LRDLLNLLKSNQEDFSSISAGLASPQMVRSWSFGEVKKNQKLSTIEHLNQNVTVYFVQRFLVQLKTTSAFAENIRE